MNSIRNILTAFILIGLLITIQFSRAQTLTTIRVVSTPTSTVTSIAPIALQGTDVSSLRTLSDDQLTAFVNALDAMPTLATTSLPRNGLVGSFWSLQHPEWPPLPMDGIGANVWPLSGSDGGYLLDDVSVDYDALSSANSSRRLGLMLEDDGGMYPPGYDGSDTNVYTPEGLLPPPDYGTNLYLAQFQLTNGFMTGIASNTLADVEYSLLTNSDLTTTNWMPLTPVLFGSELTNWTPLGLLPFNPTNNLFFRLRSEMDSDNVGIPDWWQLQYFGHIGIDPYAASPSGDGFSIWQKYQNKLNPNQFEIPPAPANFVAVLSTNEADVLLSWSPAQGTVVDYSIVRGVYNPDTYDYDYTTVATVSAGTTEFTDVGAIEEDNDQNDLYTLTADYEGDNTSDTAFSQLYDTAPPPPSVPALAYNLDVSANLVRNATGRWQLMFAGLPANAQSINLIWTDTNGVATTQNIFAGALTNGIYQIPDTDIVNDLGDTVSVQGMDVNGNPGSVVQVGVIPQDAPYFVDGRQSAKQNLIFLIRAADPDLPYMGANWPITTGAAYNQTSTNFEEFSFLHHADTYDEENMFQFVLDDLWPFSENYHLANFILDPNTYTNRNPQIDLVEPYYQPRYAFNFVSDFATNLPAPAILSGANPYWIVQPEFYYLFLEDGRNSPLLVGVDVPDGGYYTGFDTATLPAGEASMFGFPYQTGCLISVNDAGRTPPLLFQTLAPGGTETISSSENTQGYVRWQGYASQCAAPTLALNNYYFAPLINPNANPMNLPGSLSSRNSPVQYPTPLEDTFDVTNETPPVIIGAVGQPMIVASWAKYAVENGGTPSGKYAYLGQYFTTNAFLLDNTGSVTTNSAGILSPYGEFFPTQAGTAQLITMPDLDTGQQGTCTVSIVSLNVDANHDGTMDLSYFGQDQTSPSKPCVFWCNDNFDRWHTVDGSDTEQDDLPPQKASDYDYTVGGTRVIPCVRDLEDFSRLWITGVTTNLLAALPSGSTVTLNWGDVGSPNSGTPTIDLFQAADTDGGTGYLTNNTVAAQQIDNTQSWYIGRLTPGGSLQLNAIQFNGFWAGNHFVWCGVANGSGKLNLTFQDANGHTFGQASVYIQIKDIKQMYERWTVGDNGNKPPTSSAINAQEDGLGGFEAAFNYGPATTNTPYILFVHGWNMQIWEKDRYAETAFKRLWWQGYQGRFGSFRWPTFAGFPLGEFSSQAINPRNFDNSEYNAWLSGVGLLNKLNDLNAAYPGKVYLMAHSMGNVVAGEALRLAGTSRVVNTYIAMQGAVSAHAYDPTTPTRLLGIGGIEDSGTPDRYANYWTNGAPSYFNASAGAGAYVNFFNTNDYALTGSWLLDQNAKPDNSITSYPGYHYDVSSLHPNGFYAQFGSGTNDYHNLNFPGDTYTIFAYCDEARSKALGSQVDVDGAFNEKQIDLQSVWPPDTTSDPTTQYSAHKWHSAEFRSDSANRWGFWSAVLGQNGFNIK